MGRRQRALEAQLMFERRVLFGVTGLAGLCIIIWIWAISSDYWFEVYSENAPEDPRRREGGIWVNETRRFFLKSNSGIWRICRTTYANNAMDQRAIFTRCRSHEMFPSELRVRLDPSLDKVILNYNRTEASFAIISLLLMFMGFFFSIYTFRNPRYMFKRLAGGLHFITAGCVFIVIEIMINSIAYEREHIQFTHPKGATYQYGYSFALAWVVVITYICGGLAFLIYSRKRKGSKAPNEEIAMADEPTIIGR
ncbi:voltage-dependent calcium channel gamma-1 subunit [Ischnura elegans]|uniref:voltage-dependent calcium channel gamma-1 subunit n=1 Tax=Ischnura elegans TaxID=197161 RepID=UPI001ED8BA11|nr:voltage-dependent calcium channel gamma-1 subunit [Ischnura elegans]XP_046402963.1 voltage-dependent calcium channel gamma-1 subunit [Ischnura elegans]